MSSAEDRNPDPCRLFVSWVCRGGSRECSRATCEPSGPKFRHDGGCQFRVPTNGSGRVATTSRRFDSPNAPYGSAASKKAADHSEEQKLPAAFDRRSRRLFVV